MAPGSALILMVAPVLVVVVGANRDAWRGGDGDDITGASGGLGGGGLGGLEWVGGLLLVEPL